MIPSHDSIVECTDDEEENDFGSDSDESDCTVTIYDGYVYTFYYYFFPFYCCEIGCFVVCYRIISNRELLDHSYLWLLKHLENSYFESEMEVASIIMRWLNIHGDSLQPHIIDLIVKSLRVTSLKEYFLSQILPYCKYFCMSKQKISAILEYQKNQTPSPFIYDEWMLPQHDTDPQGYDSDLVNVLNWAPCDMKKQEFFRKRHPGTVDISPMFINFLGVKMIPKLTFHAPNIIVEVTAEYWLMSDDECMRDLHSVERINCEFSLFFRKGDRERKYSGIFSESTVNLSCNIMDWEDSDPFAYFDYLKEMQVLFFVKRFDV